MKKLSVFVLNELVKREGLQAVTNQMNTFRGLRGLKPIQPKTVRRYQSGYANGLPYVATAFVRTRI